ncbi:Transforming growth factor beta receptor type 3 [Rhynchospora pubera]|uniref:Transforming growth factor beta receptor type 3 n=1 Tax=Rhynchospora pubera TaxID=906938 RepID=A0AAV8FG42_9POAL|nr:Transforming growth factor beta receptor type 3 [Rhynchospora pubera]KAJ4792500.1 Transforming growth factor beta receptor type 3 [Rhynchospora pubera]KAJ4816327.1 Transforming growth factor beta receptor type 3 [Rhynchospora pubera]
MARFIFALILASYSILLSTSFARHLPESSLARPPSSSLHLNIAQAPIVMSHENAALERHGDFDRSKTGGEIIIAGLATATLAAIVCYIRVTRQKNEEGKL